MVKVRAATAWGNMRAKDLNQMEPGQINSKISDLQGRCSALRGYL